MFKTVVLCNSFVETDIFLRFFEWKVDIKKISAQITSEEGDGCVY